jgi:hypothetical protein
MFHGNSRRGTSDGEGCLIFLLFCIIVAIVVFGSSSHSHLGLIQHGGVTASQFVGDSVVEVERKIDGRLAPGDTSMIIDTKDGLVAARNDGSGWKNVAP